jgi:hypothetical protein
VRLEGLGQFNNAVTSGIEPTTFQLVRQCLNQLCYSVPHMWYCSSVLSTDIMTDRVGYAQKPSWDDVGL